MMSVMFMLLSAHSRFGHQRRSTQSQEGTIKDASYNQLVMRLNSAHALKVYDGMRTRKSLSFAAVSSLWHCIRTVAFEYPSSVKTLRIPSFTNIQIQRSSCSYSRSIKQLYSTMIDESSIPKRTMDMFPIPTGSTVAASGSILSFSPSSNLRDAIMVIKIREDDLSKSDESRVSATSMFQSAKKKANSQGDDFTGKSVLFSDGRQGVIVAQRPPLAFVLCDFHQQNDRDDDVAILNTRTTIPVSDSLVGKAVDCFGQVVEILNDGSVVDFLNPVLTEPFMRRDMFAPIPQVKDISLINRPLLTGTAMIDALAPIGRGQNMLIVGEHDLGQRDILVGALKTQIHEMKQKLSKGITCIYAITSLDSKERAFVVENLRRAGVLGHIILVTTRDQQHVDLPQKGAAAYAEAVTVAATACALGEAFALSKSHDCAVFIDNIDQHKQFWDWTTRTLVGVYGIEAVVKADLDGGASSEMRAFYSGLIQRAARFNKKNGDGSVTLILVTNFPAASGYDDDDENTVFSVQDFAHLNGKLKERLAILEKKQIPLTPSNLRKINIPLPIALDADRARLLALQNVDDLISMTDGQIWLDERLFAKGQRPAMDPQRSITRVGIGADTDSRADAPIIRKIVGGLRFEFAQALSLDGSAIGANVDKQLLKRDAYLLAMKQNSGEVRRLCENSVLLLAASIGGLDSVAQKDNSITVQEYIEGLLQHVETQLPTIMSNIDANMDATPFELDELRKAILHYASKGTE